jgi:hypothetical protein
MRWKSGTPGLANRFLASFIFAFYSPHAKLTKMHVTARTFHSSRRVYELNQAISHQPSAFSESFLIQLTAEG